MADMTEQETRALLDSAFVPAKAAVDRGDTDDVLRIYRQFQGAGHQVVADAVLDLAADVLRPGRSRS